MAFVFRSWRLLLVLNVLMVAVFVTFWAKSNTSSVKRALGPDPSGGGGGDGDSGKQPQSNGTALGSSIAHEVLLRRLGSLEDVVYRQLNGRQRASSHLHCAISSASNHTTDFIFVYVPVIPKASSPCPALGTCA